jgi:hypothetical protein
VPSQRLVCPLHPFFILVQLRRVMPSLLRQRSEASTL